MHGWLWQRLAATEEDDGGGLPRPRHGTLVLSMATLVRKQARSCRAPARGGAWGWWREGEKDPFARLGYEVDASDPGHAWLRLDYRVNGTPVDYRVRLVTTQPTYGGQRWWFVCPLAAPGRRPATTGRQALPAAGRALFRQPCRLRADLHLVPGERAVPGPVSSSRRRAGYRRKGSSGRAQKRMATMTKQGGCAALELLGSSTDC